jgi:hypothetical protein
MNKHWINYKMKKKVTHALMLVVACSSLGQAQSSSQLQVGFHYEIDNRFPIFYRDSHISMKEDSIYFSQQGRIVQLNLFVQSDINGFKNNRIPIKVRNGNKDTTLIFDVNVHSCKYIIKKESFQNTYGLNRDTIKINTQNRTIEMFVRANTLHSYTKNFIYGTDTIFIIVQHDLQIKTIPYRKSTRERDATNRNRKLIDSTFYCFNGETDEKNLKKEEEPQGINNDDLFHRSHLQALITQDSAKGILHLFFKTYSNMGDDGNESVINPLDSVGDFYIKIGQPRQRIQDPTYFVSIPYHALDIGVITVPLKLVYAPSVSGYGNVITNLNAGLYLGYEYGRTRFFLNPAKTHTAISFIGGGFVSTTAISLNSSTSRIDTMRSGGATGTRTANGVTGPITANALGISYGLAAQLGVKNFNFAILYGWDVLIPTGWNYEWVYDGKPWIGFGISYNIGIFNNGATPNR